MVESQRHNLEAASEKKFRTYKKSSIKLIANFSSETIEMRRQGHDIIKVLKDKIAKQEFDTSKLFSKEEGKNKTLKLKNKIKKKNKQTEK